MAGRIEARFKELKRRGECALIPFIVAGDHDLDETRALVLELERRGADLIELGVPFTDPMADGPANQRALARGLRSGASLSAILGTVADLRKETNIPIILFGYFNPILQYGCERFCADAAAAGVDGLLVVDLPPEESEELAVYARRSGIDIIFLMAPTTPVERAKKIARKASGFIYYVSVTGVTGTRAALPEGLGDRMGELHGLTRLPIGVGFGISNAEQAHSVAAVADAVVVGSALSLILERQATPADGVAAVGELVGSMKDAMRAARAVAAAAGE
jgi:tryptophan synthase alpha chain